MARINTLGNFLTDVADAIREKRNIDTPIYPVDYDTEIRNISTIPTVDTIGTAELPDGVTTITGVHASAIGEYFISTNMGMYILNRETETFIPILSDIGNSLYFDKYIESKTGDIFIYSTAGVAGIGIYKYNRDMQIFSIVYHTLSTLSQPYVSSTNEVFISSASNGVGILRWDADTGTFVQAAPDTAAYWYGWFEDSLGNMFVAPRGGTGLGIRKFNTTTKMFEPVYNLGTYWGATPIVSALTTSAGDLFVCAPAGTGTGVLKFNRTTNLFELIPGSAATYGGLYIFIDNNDNVFASSSSTGTTNIDGISRYDPISNTFIQAFSGVKGFARYIYCNNGDTFAASNTRVLKFNNTTGLFDSIATVTNLNVLFTDRLDNIFYSNSSNSIIYMLNRDTNTFINVGETSTSGTAGALNYFVDSQYNIFISRVAANSGVYKFNRTTNRFYQISNFKQDWTVWKERDGKVFASTNLLSSEIMYDEDTDSMVVTRDVYSSIPFGSEHTCYGSASSPTFMFGEDSYQIFDTGLALAVADYVVMNGRYAILRPVSFKARVIIYVK